MKLYQPKKKKKKIGRKIVALFILCLIVFSVFKGCQATLRYVENNDHFKITEIKITAPSHIQKPQILAYSGLNKGMGIYSFSKNDLKKKIKQHPWVNKVSIKRRLPSTVEIIVQSKEVRALTKIENYIYYIDNDGKLIDKLIPGFKMNMPVINAKPEEYIKVINILDTIKNIHTGSEFLDSEVSEVFIEENILTIYPSLENIKILIDINRPEQCLKNVKKVLDNLKERGEKASIIDATLPGNKVVVRGIRK
ncbi:MAG: FtsQ-type POTRA domain-containing protein [bacterium]